MRFEKWGITGWLSLLVLAMVIIILITSGTNEHGLGVALRATARTSAILFCLAFSTTALLALDKNRATRWLRANRRYVGVSFAVSHFLHLGLIVWLALAFPDPFFADRGAAEFVGGGLAYFFIAAMAATSFDKTTRWLGAQRWRLLHLVGGWYIWFIFAQRYAKTVIVEPSYVPLALLFAAVLVLRLWVRFDRKSR